MALIHVKRRLLSSSPAPPPPSPIPNTTDTPSDSSETPANLSRFAQNMITNRSNVFNLPDIVRRSVMAGIDYQLLVSGDKDSVTWLLRLAAEFGVFRIKNLGLEVDDLRKMLTEEFGWMFELSTSKFVRWVDDRREEFTWCGNRGKEIVGTRQYRIFRQEIENVANKLETIAEELGHIFATKLQSSNEIQQHEATLILSRHNHPKGQHSSYDKPQQREADLCKHGLSLHFPLQHGQFCILSEQIPSAFNTGPDTIVISIGRQLAEWSKGEFKYANGEVNFKPEFQVNKSSFSFELKCSPSSLIRGVSISKTIYLVDQIVITLVVVIAYKMVSLM